MDPLFEKICLVAFLLLMAAPGVYGVHLYALMWLAMRRRKSVRAQQSELVARYQRSTPAQKWPRVTTQLPIFNEPAVAERVIRAIAAFDYPRDLHEIQVLDDSIDETRTLVDRVCAELKADGFDIRVIRRSDRRHFKAGALAHGLEQSSGSYIAIFDADFVPQPDFLRRLIPLIEECPDACCVQGRWGHLNRGESWMTQALALGMDGHFGVEQGARGWNGFLLNFNGTAGIWRREAIVDPRVGGWSGDTITEDLDLSYRAQLAGWKILYSDQVVAPAEIPADAPALKAQQRRWATGSIQTARKLLPRVWRSDLTWLQKIEATIHLTQYAVNFFMVLMILLGRPLLWFVPLELYKDWMELGFFVVLIAAGAPSIAYVYARWALDRVATGPVQILKLVCLGLGLSLNNSISVLAGLVQRGGEFVRTPKSGSTGQGGRPITHNSIRTNLWIYELLLGALCLFQWAYFLRADRFVGGTFLLLYAIGLISLGWSSRPRIARAGVRDAEATVAAPSAYVDPGAGIVDSPAPATLAASADSPSR